VLVGHLRLDELRLKLHPRHLHARQHNVTRPQAAAAPCAPRRRRRGRLQRTVARRCDAPRAVD
jgi:hypothetical protein